MSMEENKDILCCDCVYAVADIGPEYADWWCTCIKSANNKKRVCMFDGCEEGKERESD